MLPNRTYNELNESCFSQTELSEEAKLRAGLSARKNRRSSLQLTADRKALIAIYKKMQEREEQWGALEALFRDFYIVERVLNDCDERPKRLPVLLHGSHAGLPRIYDIAACMAGRRDGRIDEATVYAFMEAYQSVTPLTMAEVAELPNMLNAALVKLLTLECERALEAENSMETAKSAAAQLERIKERARREAIIDRLSLGEDPVLCECLYGMMKEHDEGIAELINAKLQLEDKSIDGLCAKATAMRRRSTQRADNVIRSLRCIGGMEWNKAFEDLSVTDRELRRDPVYGKMDGRSRSYYRASVERLSMRLGAAEQVIARQAVRLAQSGEGKEGQAGLYLFMDANEVIVRLTREDFASEEEFLKWKSWSDGNYHTEDNQDVVEGKHNTSIDGLSEAAFSIPAIDVVMERQHEKVERRRVASAMVSQIRDKLTETQFRRLWMYYIDGMTVDEIGEKEGVSHQAASLSITTAIRKIKKYF